MSDNYINGILPPISGNAYLTENKITYQILNPKTMTFTLDSKSQVNIMAWGPGGNSGPNKQSFNYDDYSNCFCNGEETYNKSLPKDGSWVWYPEDHNHTTFFDTFIFKYPIKKAPFGGGGSGAYASSNLTLDSGIYYYSIGVTSGTKTWFGPSMNISNAYVIADTGYDSTASLNKPNRDRENPNLNLENKSISYGGLGGQIPQSKGDVIIGGNKGSDSYSANNIIGGTGGKPVNPIDNFNGAGGSFGGFGEAGKILLKIESTNLDVYNFAQFYYDFNHNNTSGLSGKIIGTFSNNGNMNAILTNNLTNLSRISGYSDNKKSEIDDGSQPVPGDWTDGTNEFTFLDVNVKLTNSIVLSGKILGNLENDMRVNKKFAFNTLRCWITATQKGDSECNC